MTINDFVHRTAAASDCHEVVESHIGIDPKRSLDAKISAIFGGWRRTNNIGASSREHNRRSNWAIGPRNGMSLAFYQCGIKSKRRCCRGNRYRWWAEKEGFQSHSNVEQYDTYRRCEVVANRKLRINQPISNYSSINLRYSNKTKPL